MTTRHATDAEYDRDVAAHRAHQATVIPRLREQTADRPAHAAFLERLIAAADDDARWDLAWGRLPKGVGVKAAEALAADVEYALDRTELTRGSFWATGGGAYRAQRVADARATADRQRTREANERYADSLEGRLNAALTPGGRK